MKQMDFPYLPSDPEPNPQPQPSSGNPPKSNSGQSPILDMVTRRASARAQAERKRRNLEIYYAQSRTGWDEREEFNEKMIAEFEHTRLLLSRMYDEILSDPMESEHRSDPKHPDTSKS